VRLPLPNQSIVVLALAVLGGCSWFLPHPDSSSNVLGDADTTRDGRCSLAVAQDRRLLPRQIAAAGIPTPLIIRTRSPGASNNRNIGNDQSVEFDASTNLASPAQTAPHGTAWRIKVVDTQGEALAGDATLANGSVFALREDKGSGYLRLDTRSTSTTTTVAQAEASRFVVYKADAPDSTRPTTCDEQIREGDFVFLRVLEPSAWASVDSLGALGIQGAAFGKPVPDSHSNPRCARQEERCRTDSLGGLVCVWAPVCAE
jgi:hypothetical protein